MSTGATILARAGIGCGLATGSFVVAVVLLVGCTLIAGATNPTGSHGMSEGTGYLLVPFFPAAAVCGLVGAFFPRVGLVLTGLVVAAATALSVVLLVQYA